MKNLTTQIIIVFILVMLNFSSLAQKAGDFYRRGLEKYKSKDYSAAIIEFTRAIDADKTSAALYNMRGLSKYKIELFDEALEDFEKALFYDNSMPEVYLNQGNCFMAVVKYDEALIAYDRLLTLDSNNHNGFLKRGNVRYFMKDFKGSLEDYEKYFKLTKKPTTSAYTNRGSSKMMLGLYNEALQDFETAIKEDPTLYIALINKGICQLEMRELEAAAETFTLAIRYDSRTGESYYYRGMAHIYMVDEILADKKKSTMKGIAENKRNMDLACSDFEKSKEFRYGKSFEAIQKYCTGDVTARFTVEKKQKDPDTNTSSKKNKKDKKS